MANPGSLYRSHSSDAEVDNSMPRGSLSIPSISSETKEAYRFGRSNLLLSSLIEDLPPTGYKWMGFRLCRDADQCWNEYQAMSNRYENLTRKVGKAKKRLSDYSSDPRIAPRERHP